MNQIALSQFTNFNSAIPWGLWVVVYVWLVGISAGSVSLAMWGHLSNNPHLKKITRLSIVLSLSALLAGLLSILVDLSHMERFYKLFLSPNPRSPMAWMVWLYNLYALILIFFLLRLKKGIPKAFFGFTFIFAFAIIIIESLLFALPPGKLWHSAVFPLHFLTSSLVSAVAALIVAVSIVMPKKEKADLIVGLSRIAVPLIAINLAVEIMDMFLIGGLNHIESWISAAGNFIVIVLLLRRSPLSIIIIGYIELVGVFLTKYNGLISAQVIQPFRGFAKAYIEPRTQFHYIPAYFEYLLALFLIGLAIGMFYFLYSIFPFTREE